MEGVPLLSKMVYNYMLKRMGLDHGTELSPSLLYKIFCSVLLPPPPHHPPKGKSACPKGKILLVNFWR